MPSRKKYKTSEELLAELAGSVVKHDRWMGTGIYRPCTEEWGGPLCTYGVAPPTDASLHFDRHPDGRPGYYPIIELPNRVRVLFDDEKWVAIPDQRKYDGPT